MPALTYIGTVRCFFPYKKEKPSCLIILAGKLG